MTETETLEGRLVHLRRLSAKLVFADLQLHNASSVELVLKAAVGGHTVESIATTRALLKQGDLLRVTGVREPGGSLSLLGVTVLSRWCEEHPGVAFQPQPGAGGAMQRAGAVAPAASAELCKFYLNTGRCALGALCARRHERGEAAAWVAERRAARKQLSASQGNPYALSSLTKCQRAAVFADWLLCTFGAATLRRKAGVLDVAGGGAGGLAFALHLERGIPTTILDPREPHLSRTQRARAAQLGVDLNANGALAAHIPLLFEPSTWHHAAGRSLIVGMHPDQATDGIVDCAVKLGLPFAIVPCCIFQSLFALQRGARLRTRAELVAHLMAKAPGSETAWLPFEGANQVVFWRGAADARGLADSDGPHRRTTMLWWDERGAG